MTVLSSVLAAPPWKQLAKWKEDLIAKNHPLLFPSSYVPLPLWLRPTHISVIHKIRKKSEARKAMPDCF